MDHGIADHHGDGTLVGNQFLRQLVGVDEANLKRRLCGLLQFELPPNALGPLGLYARHKLS